MSKNQIISQIKKINSELASMPAEKRPMMANGFRAQRVDYSAGKNLEVTTDHGHVVFAPISTFE